MPKAKPPIFDLPVTAVSTRIAWLAQRTTDELKSAFQAAEGHLTAIILDAPNMTRSRPKNISFLIEVDHCPTVVSAASLDPDILSKVAAAALILESDLKTEALFDNVDRVSQMGRSGKFQQIAVTPHGVIGWHPRKLTVLKSVDPDIFTKGDMIGGAVRGDLQSAHQLLQAQANLSDLASRLYDLEASRLSAHKLRGKFRSANFKVIESKRF